MRYHLFQFEGYYPQGGISDYVASYDTLADAKEAIASKMERAFSEILVERDGVLVCIAEARHGFWTDDE